MPFSLEKLTISYLKDGQYHLQPQPPVVPHRLVARNLGEERLVHLDKQPVPRLAEHPVSEAATVWRLRTFLDACSPRAVPRGGLKHGAALLHGAFRAHSAKASDFTFKRSRYASVRVTTGTGQSVKCRWQIQQTLFRGQRDSSPLTDALRRWGG